MMAPRAPPQAPGPLIPEHYFRALCQYEACRAKLGGFHIPSAGGMVLFACHKCRHVSVFRNESHGISSYLLDANGHVLDKRTGRPAEAAGMPTNGVPVNGTPHVRG